MKKYLLLISLFISFLSFSPVHAQNSCRTVIGKGSKQFQTESFNRNLVHASHWLANNIKNIDPEKTHLARLVPMVLKITTEVKRKLPFKADELYHADRSVLVEQVIQETLDRIKNKNLTYEYIFALPFRMGALLDMENTIQYNMSRVSENRVKVPSAYIDANYASHESFKELIKSAYDGYVEFHKERGILEKDLSDDAANNYSVWVLVYKVMKNFEKAPMLPALGDLSIESMNAMSRNGVWPIGLATTPQYVDGVDYSEFHMPIHDLLHAVVYFFDYRPNPFQNLRISSQLTRQHIDPIKNAIYDQIINSQYSGKQLELLHLLHHIYFHEVPRTAFTTLEAFSPTDAISNADKVREVLNKYKAKLLIDPKFVNPNDFFDHNVLDLAERIPDPTERKTTMNEIFKIYFGFLESTLRE